METIEQDIEKLKPDKIPAWRKEFQHELPLPAEELLAFSSLWDR